MFNLEESIIDWRRRLRRAGVRNPEVLDELECHLRDDLECRMRSGETQAQAFDAAVRAMGEGALLHHEFAKVSGRNWAWARKLKAALVGIFAPVPSLSGFSPGALRTLELAQREAPRLRHGFVGTEHLLLGLLALQEGTIPNVLNKLGIDRADLKRQIENCVAIFPTSELSGPLAYTPRVRKSLRLAAKEAKTSQDAHVGPEHIFLGLVLEGDGVAGRVLNNLGLKAETTRAEIRRELDRSRGPGGPA